MATRSLKKIPCAIFLLFFLYPANPLSVVVVAAEEEEREREFAVVFF